MTRSPDADGDKLTSQFQRSSRLVKIREFEPLDDGNTSMSYRIVWVRACIVWCCNRSFPALRLHELLLPEVELREPPTGGGID